MRDKIVTGNIYHVLSRGVDKRKIFLDDKDYYRFVHDLFEFNDEDPTFNVGYFFRNKSIDVRRQYIGNRKPRKLLVEILAFCLMPNHYHLLIRPLSDDAVSRFMKKLNTGYAKYFNGKYKRKGALFESRYKLVPIVDEAHFIHIPYYIHLNPLDLVAPEWRSREMNNYPEAVKFLENYRWSSHLDYAGVKNFPSVTSREFLLEIFGGHEGYTRKVKKWIKDLEIGQIKNLTLED